MHSANILVVDDTLANLELLEKILDDAGYDVRTSISAEVALRAIEAQKPDLVLLDIMMPGLDGYQACDRIKQIPAMEDVPIIFLSAKGESDDKVKAFEHGAVDYLVKPFDVDEILVRIKTHLSVHFLKKELEHKIEIIDKYVITSTTDTEGIITDVSEAFCQISGYTKEELLGKRHNILRHDDIPDALYQDLWKTITKGLSWRGEIKNLTKDGGYYWVDAIISPIFDTNHTITGYTSVRHDITDKKKIEELSITDQLTGLYNRHHFIQVIPAEIKRSVRDRTHLSFVMLDIDFFKQYNDNYGHQKGDDVLESISHALTSVLKREGDNIFRLGGEEFGILYTTDNYEHSLTIGEQICKSIEALRIEHAFSQAAPVVTASLGMACIDFSQSHNFTIDLDELYKIADQQLYKAKEEGRNRLLSIHL